MGAADPYAELRDAALKAREFTLERGERVFTLRTPTRHEVRQTLHEHKLLDAGGRVLVLQLLQYQLARAGLVGWAGVRVRDVLPGSEDAAPLPWSAATVDIYLDAQPDDADAIGAELFARASVRSAAIEDDAKN